MNIFNSKNLLLILVMTLFPVMSFAAIKDMRVTIKEYSSGNPLFGAVRVTLINDSVLPKKGRIIIIANNLQITYSVNLQISEKKFIDIPLFLNGGGASISVVFGNEEEHSYTNHNSSFAFESGVLEIKSPRKGQLFFKYGASDKLEDKCTVERIDLEQLPLQVFCIFQYQLIVIPSEVEVELTSEQFQLLKNYVGFGGRIMIIDPKGILPARWKTLNQNTWGAVYAIANQESIDFEGKLEYVSVDPRQSFFKTDFNPKIQESSKGLYLLIVLLFIVFIGPVNFYFLQKKNKKFLIFFTSPIIAVLFSALLIAVFFIKEGFYKKYDGTSLTIVDAQNSQAIVYLKNSVYFSTISGELERERTGMYFPLNFKYRQNNYIVNIDSKAHLSGNFAKARSANEFGTINMYECNSKITIRVDNNKIYAKNSFGTKQKIRIIDTKNLIQYDSKVTVEPDQEVLLELVEKNKSNKENIENKNLLQMIDSSVQLISINKDKAYIYVAYSDSNEFVQFQVKDGYIQGENLHVILGVINQ